MPTLPKATTLATAMAMQCLVRLVRVRVVDRAVRLPGLQDLVVTRFQVRLIPLVLLCPVQLLDVLVNLNLVRLQLIPLN